MKHTEAQFDDSDLFLELTVYLYHNIEIWSSVHKKADVQKETGGKIHWNEPLAWSNKLRSLCRILTIVVSPAPAVHHHINHPLVLLLFSTFNSRKTNCAQRAIWINPDELKTWRTVGRFDKIAAIFPIHPFSVGLSVSSCLGVCDLCHLQVFLCSPHTYFLLVWQSVLRFVWAKGGWWDKDENSRQPERDRRNMYFRLVVFLFLHQAE